MQNSWPGFVVELKPDVVKVNGAGRCTDRTTKMFRNVCIAIIICAAFYGLNQVAPDAYSEETVLNCPRLNEPVATFSSMDTCAVDPRYLPGCSCGRLSNPWSFVYTYVIAPLLVSLIAYVGLNNSVRKNLFIMNLAALVGGLLVFIQEVIRYDVTINGLPFLPIVGAGLVILLSGYYGLISKIAGVAGISQVKEQRDEV